MKTKLLKKEKNMGSKLIPFTASDRCCLGALWPSKHEEEAIPRDVPKGHLVVYVGEDYKRYVINIAILKHPLFKALLDQAREEYDFDASSKLCIPCDDDVFLSVIRCATSVKDRRTCAYLSSSIPGARFNS